MNPLLRSRIIQSKPLQLIIQTLRKWQQDECLEMGAALSYYALFSLFPLLLVILSIFGFLLGSDTKVYNQILELAKGWLPLAAYSIVESTLSHLHQSSISAGVVSFFLLLFTASSIFGTLARAIDKIWQVRTRRHANNRPAHYNLIANA
ncbi:MAG: YihY/virulence factor BrkB family protein, partial [Prochloraceae cyanobacterium]